MCQEKTVGTWMLQMETRASPGVGGGGVVYFLLEHPNDVGGSDLLQSVVCTLGGNT